jgi:hypothetical protein
MRRAWIRRSVRRASWLGGCLTVALIAYAAMQEIGNIIGDVAVRGVLYPAGALYSVFEAAQAPTAMREWAVASCTGSAVRAWLIWLLAFDLVFIAGYAGLGFGANARWARLKIGGLVAALVAADLIEDALTAAAVGLMPGGANCTPVSYHHAALFGFLAAATVVKTILAAAIVLKAGWVVLTEDRAGLADGERAHRLLREIVKALGIQRFIVIIVAVLGVLLLVGGVPILEQGIDVERSWVLISDHWLGAGWAVWAAALMILLACALRYLASVRAAPFEIVDELHEETVPDGPDREATPSGTVTGQAPASTVAADDVSPAGAAAAWDSWLRRAFRAPVRWVVSFGRSLWGSRRWLLLSWAAAGVIFALGATPVVRIYHQAVLSAAIVLTALPVAGAVFSRVTPLPEIDVLSHGVRNRAWQIGRALAWAVPAILLASVCRSLTAPIILLPAQRLLCAIVFAAAAVAAVAWVCWFLRDNTPKARGRAVSKPARFSVVHPQLVGARRAEGATWVPGPVASLLPSVAAVCACAVPVLIFPVATSRFLSVIGVVGLGLLLLTASYAVLQILAQLTDPPAWCGLLGLRRAPVVTIVLLTGVLSAVVAAGTSLHAISGPVAAGSDRRPTLQAALTSWLARQSPACAISAGGVPGVRVQPLVLVAAEGGGARAAWWTVDVMSSLTSTNCGRRSVFLASGVSGGAVGLAVMATSAEPYRQMSAIAGPDALAAATDGLLSRDLLAGTFGVNIRAVDGPAGVPFPDRAALIEQTWERQAHGLTAPFPRTGASKTVPWYTVFNATSVANKCRLLVSDVKLTTSTRCDDPANPIPGSYDFFSAEPCDIGITTATGSLLAARFPYVTPSAVLTACTPPHAFSDQVIDGGYSENSGIATLNGALTQLMPVVRAHNRAALQAGRPVVVPLVMFLHNSVIASDGSQPHQQAANPEALIPLTNQSDSAVLGAPATLLQTAATLAADWIPDTQTASQASMLRTALSPVLATQTMTIAPQKQPALALPLGWTLSQGTRGTLDQAFNAYLTCHPAGTLTCTQSRTYDTLVQQWGTPMQFPRRTKGLPRFGTMPSRYDQEHQGEGDPAVP